MKPFSLDGRLLRASRPTVGYCASRTMVPFWIPGAGLDPDWRRGAAGPAHRFLDVLRR